MGCPISPAELEEGFVETCAATLMSIEKMRECSLRIQRLPNATADTTKADALETRLKAIIAKKRQLVSDQTNPPPQAEDDPVRLHFYIIASRYLQKFFLTIRCAGYATSG